MIENFLQQAIKERYKFGFFAMLSFIKILRKSKKKKKNSCE